jgi:hypothetical protein
MGIGEIRLKSFSFTSELTLAAIDIAFSVTIIEIQGIWLTKLAGVAVENVAENNSSIFLAKIGCPNTGKSAGLEHQAR